MDARARKPSRRSARRLASRWLATIGVAAVAMFVTALPASASLLALSGSAMCTNGNHVITWTITNADSSRTVTITSAQTSADPLTYDVTGYNAVLAPGATTHGTSVLPGSATGGVALYVYESWTDGSGSDHIALDLGDPCPTTTTTTTAEATTTTTVPRTTTSTSVASTTSTTVAAAGSTVATTASTSVTTVAAAQLPRTGSSGTGLMAGMVTVAVGGLALALGRKRHGVR
jgi:LPXTG-motif cell wall-anchored protein